MKTIALIALALCVAVLAACGSSNRMAAAVPASHGEFDPTTGSWKPLERVVPAPPPQEGAVIAERKGPGVMGKVGKTLKKPLKWVGLGKGETPPPASSAPDPIQRE